MSKIAEVVTLYEANASDIPAMARKFADKLASGEYGDVSSVVVVTLGPETLDVFGWGREAGNRYYAAGLLTAAAQKLTA